MQKTKLGVSVGLLGAAIYFVSLFGSYIVPVIFVGYVLLFEDNEWLRKSSVKAIAVLICFSLLGTAIHIIPDVIECIDDIAIVFNGRVNAALLSKIENALSSATGIIEKVLFIGLGLKALNQGSISVPVVDKLINKYM